MKTIKKLTAILLIFKSAFLIANDKCGTSKQDFSIENRDKFRYVDLGLYFPYGPTAALGFRKLNSHHVWDFKVGTAMFLTYYGECSYLYFPKQNEGVYFGAGVLGGVSAFSGLVPFGGTSKGVEPLYFDLPLTLGYQFSTKKEKMQFVEFKVGVADSTFISHDKWIPTARVSYGIEF